MVDLVTDQVQNIIQKLQGHLLERIYYISSGESLAFLYPSKYIADREAKSISTDIYQASEFYYRKPVALGESTLVIICSDDTDDVLEAARFVKEKNAITIGIANQNNSKLKNIVDHFVLCDRNSMSNSEYSALYQITTGIIQEREPEAYPTLYKGMVQALNNIDVVCQRAIEQFSELCNRFVEESTRKQIIAIASGTNYAQPYFMSQNKSLQKHGVEVKAIHAGQFIQRTSIDSEQLFVVFLGIDATREVEERALSLVERSNHHVFVFDAKTIDFTGIERAFSKVMPPLVFASITETLIHKIANMESRI